MSIKIVCVGKIKESYFREAENEYRKRISRYSKIEILENTDEKTPETASEAEKEAILKKEGRRILACIKDTDYVLALAIRGTSFSSGNFSSHIDCLLTSGKSSLVFVIGGSLGLSEEVLQRSDEEISFSDFTFPHQLMRIILLEQIYRSFKIMKNEPYHK